jgi:hypothetical protein
VTGVGTAWRRGVVDTGREWWRGRVRGKNSAFQALLSSEGIVWRMVCGLVGREKEVEVEGES